MNTELPKETHTGLEGAVPIREISRLTGVNSVTLRAWERRYGLLKPLRTGKGHRLYSQDDIQKVKDIQAWLVRGLAISKVKAVLASHTDPDTTVYENAWQDYSSQLMTALQGLNRRKIDALLSEIFSTYPIEVIADQLLAPLLNDLQQPGYANASRKEFLLSCFRERIYIGQSYQRQNPNGPRIFLVKLTDENDIFPLMLNYSLLINGYQAEFFGYIPLSEWIYAVEQLKPQAIIVYSDSAVGFAEIRHEIARLPRTLNSPVFFAGSITALIAAENETGSKINTLGHGLQKNIAQLIAQLPSSLNEVTHG